MIYFPYLEEAPVLIREMVKILQHQQRTRIFSKKENKLDNRIFTKTKTYDIARSHS